MPIQLSPAALRQANLLIDAGCRGCGLLVGSWIGHHLLLDELVPAPFTRSTLDRVWAPALEAYGDRLHGVWFCRRPPFVSDWFLEGLVMSIDDSGISYSRCVFTGKREGAWLEPLQEGEGTE